MKKIALFLVAAALFSGCSKEPTVTLFGVTLGDSVNTKDTGNFSIIEDEGRYITEVVFGPTISKNEKNYVIVKEEGYPDYKSKKYYTESLRLIDAMCGLNEIIPPIDLEEFDLVLANKTE